jgi:hypothetical protein
MVIKKKAMGLLSPQSHRERREKIFLSAPPRRDRQKELYFKDMTIGRRPEEFLENRSKP